MWNAENTHDQGWFLERLKRHFSELVRLAVPAMMMRIGIMMLGIVDTAMVGHYATQHLAWLNLANQSIMMFAIVVGLGLMTGILVYTANACGEEDYKEAGRVWRRAIPFTIIASILMVAFFWPSESWLALLGQRPIDAAEGGALAQILLIGLPGHLIFVNCTMFLEGIKRPHIGFYAMMIANIINVVINYALIYGHWGAPEMGAAGSAWASSAVRWSMAITVFLYVWFSPSIVKTYGVRNPTGQKWGEWAHQRKMGYASAISLAAEVAAFAALAIFAGWIGTVAIASFGVMYQLLGIPLVAAVGIGIATSVRTGIAFARKDRTDTLLAGLSGMIMTLLVTGVIGAAALIWTEELLSIFTDDMRIIDLLVPLALIFTLGMVFDGAQMTVSSTLRGLKETWWPTALQAFTFAGVMLPVSYILAIDMGMGFAGLVWGTLVGVIISWALQVLRFAWLLRKR